MQSASSIEYACDETNEIHNDTQRHAMAYLLSCDPSPCPTIPLGEQVAQRMSGAKRDASQEGPFFTDEPSIILFVVSVCQQGIEGGEGEAIEMSMPWDGSMQARSSNFSGCN